MKNFIKISIAVIFAFIKATQIGHSNAGNDKMKEISDAIAEGARAFLFAEYKILIIFSVVFTRFCTIMSK